MSVPIEKDRFPVSPPVANAIFEFLNLSSTHRALSFSFRFPPELVDVHLASLRLQISMNCLISETSEGILTVVRWYELSQRVENASEIQMPRCGRLG